MWATVWVAVVGDRDRDRPRLSRSPTGCRATCRAGCGALLLVLVVVPFWTSYLLRVYSWLTILGEKGLLNRFLQWTGHHAITRSALFLYDRPAVILVLVYLYFPFAALTLYSSIERFDWDQLRAAMDLGATPLTRDPAHPAPADPAGAS